MPLCTPVPKAVLIARDCSSAMMASWAKLPPPPPYSSGMLSSSMPASPARFQASRSMHCSLAQRSSFGTSSSAMKRRTESWKITRSSVIQED
ncbi:hypothetical protein D9M71_746560 [compost metagenome]